MDLTDLRARLGSSTVMTDRDLIERHRVDWTGRWQGTTPAVVVPRSVGDVVILVNWCATRGVGLVAQGGNTGLVGGATPMGGELVVVLTALDGIDVDADAGTLIAGAGATLAGIQQAARAAGWRYGIDLAARDGATVGGMIATNAGGLEVLRYGDTRHQLLGVEAVTGAGEIVGDLRGLVKDNTGYHLPSLLAGSEGTLAIITRACLRLVPVPEETATALIGFASTTDALTAARSLHRAVHDIAAIELFVDAGLELVCERMDLPRPFPRRYAAYVLVEAAGDVGVMDRLGTAAGAIVASDAPVAVATDQGGRARLWRYREAHTEAINLVGVPHKLDVTLPSRAMAGFVVSVGALVAECDPSASVWLFGHVGDGNLHVNITGPDPDDHTTDRAVLELVARLGGSISSEHGIGRAKAPMLHLNRTAAELAVFERVRTAFDPAGILNPGVLTDR